MFHRNQQQRNLRGDKVPGRAKEVPLLSNQQQSMKFLCKQLLHLFNSNVNQRFDEPARVEEERLQLDENTRLIQINQW